MYGRRKKENIKQQQILTVVCLLLAVWILTASITGASPARFIADIWNTLTGSSVEDRPTFKSLKFALKEKDSIILELETAMAQFKKSTNFRQAIVAVKTENLNMREKPVLGAKVILQLPVGSIVEVLYFDNERFRIGGEYGKWCKVKFAGQEGWVWGNYIKIIE